ncbi:hypothetical protein cyc_01699 [Cyclospora cayetanensis]|uniref:Uncharacterized protein n=1 Tax=Cyclospora cayetanensis TaxID=88456 RepID=A0A1D3CS06_9EIME|nr:hypothetical protein cyc_01699 [Cyclospora cayetanensis]
MFTRREAVGIRQLLVISRTLIITGESGIVVDSTTSNDEMPASGLSAGRPEHSVKPILRYSQVSPEVCSAVLGSPMA